MRLQDYLISSEYNDYKPWIITPQALAIFVIVIWSLRFIIPASLTHADAGIDASDLMTRVNLERTQRFIPALMTNDKLTTAATGKAKDMLTRSFFAHVDPDSNYVWPRIEATGYTPYTTLGENLAMDFTSAPAVVEAWMNSPTHRANIVNEKFEDQGMASIGGSFEPNHDTVMVVNLFGTLYKTIKPAPTPATKPPVSKTSTPSKTIAKAIPSPTPAPATHPAPPALQTTLGLRIFKEAKINATLISGKKMVDLDVVIDGNPALVTARLKSQSITLLPGKVLGEFTGSFTFDAPEDLTNQTVTVEARDKNGNKVSQDFAFNLPTSVGSGTSTPPSVSAAANVQIPVSNEAQVIKILRIVFGAFTAIYLGFLVIDGIIIHRAKIKRAGIHPDSHILLFLLVAAVTLFSNWF